MRLRPWYSPEVTLHVSDYTIIISHHPENLGSTVEDEHPPPHPLIWAQPCEGAEQSDCNMQQVEQVPYPVIQPASILGRLQLSTSVLILQPLLCIHSCLATHSCCCDGLAISCVDHISCSKHSWDTGHCVVRMQDIS